MAIVYLRALPAVYGAFQSGAVCKFNAVVYRYGFEQSFEEGFSVSPFQPVYGLDCAGGGTVFHFKDYFLAGKPFGENEQHGLRFFAAYHGIHFPMPEGLTPLYLCWPLLYAFAARRTGGANVAIVPAFLPLAAMR